MGAAQREGGWCIVGGSIDDGMMRLLIWIGCTRRLEVLWIRYANISCISLNGKYVHDTRIIISNNYMFLLFALLFSLNPKNINQ